MKALVILGLLLGVLAMLRPDSGRRHSEELQVQAVAMNFAIFRQAVHDYVFTSGHITPGDISLSVLSTPTGWSPLRSWQARIDSGCLYVWGPASAEEISATSDLFWGSYAIGTAKGGTLDPGHGGTTPIPAFVPNNNLVSVVAVE